MSPLKRLLDIGVAAVGLVVLSPLLAVVALLVRMRLGHPVVFVQVRAGHRGEPFRIYKFRTMTNARDARGQQLGDEARMTSLGRFLRRTSLDELPELVNVLKGEMSLVGPRPLLVDYLDRYNDRQRRRLDVRPGLTGWCEVNGRNALSWEEKFELDVWYVDHWSLALDGRILVATVRTVMSGTGIAPAGQVTMPPFQGTSPPPGASAADAGQPGPPEQA